MILPMRKDLQIPIKLLIICIILIPIVSATTITTQVYDVQTGVMVNTVDVDEYGDYFFGGLSNGTSFCYDKNGNHKWSTTLNASIFKVKVSPSSTYLIAGTSSNESYLIDTTDGSIEAYFKGNDATDGYIKDIDIAKNGLYTLTLFDKSMYVRYGNGFYASNITTGSYLGSSYWLNGTFDPYTNWVVNSKVANASVFKFLTKSFNGYWDINPYFLPPSAHDRNMSSYQYRTDFTTTNAINTNASVKIERNTSISSPALNTFGGVSVFSLPGSKMRSDYIDVRLANESHTILQTNNSWYQSGYAYYYETNANTSFSVQSPPGALVARVAGFFTQWGDALLAAGGSNSGNITYSYDGGKTWTRSNASNMDTNSNFAVDGNYFGGAMKWNNSLWFYAGGSGSATIKVLGRTPQTPPPSIPSRIDIINASMYAYQGTNIAALNGVIYIWDHTTDKTYASTNMGLTFYQVNSTSAFSGTISRTIEGSEGNTFDGKIWAFANGGGTRYTTGGTTNVIWVRTNATFPDIGNSGNLVYGIAVWHENQPDQEMLFYNPVDKYIYNTTDGIIWKNTGVQYPYASQYAMTIGTDYNALYFGHSDAYSTPASQRTVRSWQRVANSSWSNQSYIYDMGFKSTGNNNMSIVYGNSSESVKLPISLALIGTLTGSYTANEQSPLSGHYLDYNLSVAGTGDVQVMDVPEGGDWISWSTSDPRIYNQQITSAGFGTQYNGAASAGISYDIASADSDAYVTEARSLIADIYQLDTTQVGTYTTGGNVRSVDLSVKNGLYTTAGGDDGKLYIFSKDATSAWYVYFQGDSDSPINSVAMTMRGEYVVVGRDDGSFEVYYTQSESNDNFNTDIYVFRDGFAYNGVNISVYDSETQPYAWSLISTTQSDSLGHITFDTTEGWYYRVLVNNGESDYIFQSSSEKLTHTINIATTGTAPNWETQADYNATTGNATATYRDITGSAESLTIRLVDISSGHVVESFTCGPGITYAHREYHGSGTYEFQFDVTRGGSVYHIQKMVISSSAGYSGGAFNLNPILKIILGMFALMCIAGLATYANAPKLLWVVIGTFGIELYFGILPWNLITFGFVICMIAISLTFSRGKRESDR